MQRILRIVLALATLSTAWTRGGEAAPFLSNALPGAPARDESLTGKLEAVWAERSATYRPRTRHLNPDGTPRYTNRLFLSSSPYLIQHAHNPVDWYPWSDEAFAVAKRLGRPVLLSIGYSTCHWCHVMEEESFEDEEIARFLNEHYVAIKVDREERPDIDEIYMDAVLKLNGSGGWPMTVWVTPERKPFYAGTYFPPRDGDRGVRVGFRTVLAKLADVYRDQPDRVAAASGSLASAVAESLAGPDAADVAEAATLRRAGELYVAQSDAESGGMKKAPKFPSEIPVRFLLRYSRRSGDRRALEAATKALDGMAAGGIHDQLGGAFHRYSTDARWRVPHFEVMLYDNALLAIAYLEAFQATGRQEFASTARGILDFVATAMTGPQGGFFSALDADSPAPSGDREEGYYYTWTPAELDAGLGPERARVVAAYYGVAAAGQIGGRSVLHQAMSASDVAAALSMPVAQVDSIVRESKPILLEARKKRPPPLRDEKIVAAWNGLMISAFARGSLVLGDPQYAVVAARAADFVLEAMRAGGRLRRSYSLGRADHPAVLEDYAFMIGGCLDLTEATGDGRWLREAVALDRVLEQHFEDRGRGGFFRVSDDHEALLARAKPATDGAEPSGNSVHVLNLLRLNTWTGDDRYRQRAEAAIRAAGGILSANPANVSEMLLALDYHSDTAKEIVIVSNGNRDAAGAMLTEIRTAFVPNRVLAVADDPARAQALASLAPLLRDKQSRSGQATAYVCKKGVCDLPTTDPAVLRRQLAEVHPLPMSDSKGPPP